MGSETRHIDHFGFVLNKRSVYVQPKAAGVSKFKAGAKKLSKEDEEAIAKREAARARVQKRTMSSFGLA